MQICGSGIVCISARLTKRKYIGIEINQDYCDIAKNRLKFWKNDCKEEKQKDL